MTRTARIAWWAAMVVVVLGLVVTAALFNADPVVPKPAYGPNGEGRAWAGDPTAAYIEADGTLHVNCSAADVVCTGAAP